MHTDFITHYHALLTLWGALLLHWCLPFSSRFNPISHWHTLAEAIAEKVNQRKNGERQQILAGSLALALLWGTTGIVLLTLQQVFLPAHWSNLLFLWLALCIKPTIDLADKVENALIKQDKPQARLLLATQLDRDTLSLSETGICRACVEMLLLRYQQGIFAVLFWYCIGGSLTAIMYTLLAEICRVWSLHLNQYKQFGQTSHRLFTFIDWLPVRIFAILISTGKRTQFAFAAIRAQAEQWQEKGNGWLLAAAGAKYQISLGGSVIYDGNTQNRPHIGGVISPHATHIALINQALQKKILISIGLFSCMIWLIHG